MDNKYIPVGDFLDKSASKVKDDDDWDAWSDNQDVPMEDLSNEDSNVVEVKREATEEYVSLKADAAKQPNAPKGKTKFLILENMINVIEYRLWGQFLSSRTPESVKDGGDIPFSSS